MGTIVTGKKNIYGFSIGIIMLDMQFPRIPGDIGNAATFDFPVLYRVVHGALPDKIAEDITDEDLEPFTDAARELESAGVSAIALGCGYLSIFHERLKSAVSIPVIPSALALLPLIYRMLPPGKIVGIITADGSGLKPVHFQSSGAQNIPTAVIGLEGEREFFTAIMQNQPSMDIDVCREEHIKITEKLMNEHPDIGAILIECTNIPAYAKVIQETAKVPVFDLIHLINMVHDAFIHKDYPAFS